MKQQPKNIYSYIYRFFSHFIETNIPEVKSVDLYFDQFSTQATGQTDSLSNPRILIEVLDNDLIQGLGGIQYSDLFTVTLHIGIDIIGLFNNKLKTIDKNLAYLDLLNSIYDKFYSLTSWNLPDELWNDDFIINNVTVSRVEFATNPESIKVSQLDFTFTLENRVKRQTFLTGTVDELTLTITKQI